MIGSGWGKAHASMYTGSMVGSGSAAYAVWGYVIATMRPDREMGMQVELNPKLLGFIIGEKESVIEGVIDRFCQPDPKSRTKLEEGRKLIKLGEFDYQVVNGLKYREIRDEESRRRSNREAKRRERDRKNTYETAKQKAHKLRRKEDATDRHDGYCAGAQEEIKKGLENPGKSSATFYEQTLPYQTPVPIEFP